MQGNILKDWLTRRKISEAVISDFGIYWGKHLILGDCIVIPVRDHLGNFSFNKYRRNPLTETGPKYLYDTGGVMTLYGAWKAKEHSRILVTEGEMDALVAWSANIPAVSSTGGAGSFPKEWSSFFADKDVTFCFDNDEAGGSGMAKALEVVPHAKVLFLPDRPGIKDISDYVTNGGDLNALIETAVTLNSLEAVISHRAERVSVWQSTYFHDSYIKLHTAKESHFSGNRSKATEKITRAKEYPIDQIIKFTRGKAKCVWHNEKTGSMHYFKDSNRAHCFGCGKSGDAIDVYRKVNNCSFNEAVEALQ